MRGLVTRLHIGGSDWRIVCLCRACGRRRGWAVPMSHGHGYDWEEYLILGKWAQDAAVAAARCI